MSESPIVFNHQFRFIWHTHWSHIEDINEICSRLDGQVFTTQSLYQNILYDPIWGDLWDLENDVPLTHPNCKCHLEVIYDSTLEELLKIEPDGYEDFKIMTSNIKEMKADVEDFERSLDRANNKIENTRAQLITYLILLQKAGLPPEVDKAINIIVRARMTAEQATRALYLLMAASGPEGWLMALASASVAAIGAVGTASATQDMVMNLGGT
jgi:hypothetical protein